jgi:hypothetical protein
MIIFNSSCKKGWLDVKPSSTAVVLNTATNQLSDYERLVQNGDLYYCNYLGSVGADDYYLRPAILSSTVAEDVNYYLWAPTGYLSTSEPGWSLNYQGVFVCNTVIAGLNKINKDAGNATLWNQIYGSALFYRAYQYYQLAQMFVKPYDSTTANTDPGVPLRLEANIAEKAGRGTARQVYDQILADLTQAKMLLPSVPQQYKTQPIKGAAYALLAQTYLVMGDYINARLNADSSLSYNNSLYDYNNYVNSVTSSSNLGLPPFMQNPEVFFYAAATYSILKQTTANIDSTLYLSYSDNDLRKTLFFKVSSTGVSFRGTYDGVSRNYLFTAPAVDELYLIRAECNARLGNANAAMSDLNTLLQKRWITNTFVPLTATDANSALLKILTERRKELVMRGTRWSDLRRLNKDPRFASTIQRIYNGQVYTLAPNDNKYVWPIPNDEILYSGITQNPR